MTTVCVQWFSGEVIAGKHWTGPLDSPQPSTTPPSRSHKSFQPQRGLPVLRVPLPRPRGPGVGNEAFYQGQTLVLVDFECTAQQWAPNSLAWPTVVASLGLCSLGRCPAARRAGPLSSGQAPRGAWEPALLSLLQELLGWPRIAWASRTYPTSFFFFFFFESLWMFWNYSKEEAGIMSTSTLPWAVGVSWPLIAQPTAPYRGLL